MVQTYMLKKYIFKSAGPPPPLDKAEKDAKLAPHGGVTSPVWSARHAVAVDKVAKEGAQG